jgi:hypothetical protein
LTTSIVPSLSVRYVVVHSMARDNPTGVALPQHFRKSELIRRAVQHVEVVGLPGVAREVARAAQSILFNLTFVSFVAHGKAQASES